MIAPSSSSGKAPGAGGGPGQGWSPLDLLAEALAYAGVGLPVLPLHDVTAGHCSCNKGEGCGQPGKHPRTLHGTKDASTDPLTIRAWWAAWPAANVGIATGAVEGAACRVWMLGPDGSAGRQGLRRLEAEHGSLPRTPRSRSGSADPGNHYVFAWPADGSVRNRVDHLGLPIDVRGEGGLFVAPPSLHKSGNRYAWEVPPGEVPFAPAPDWLLAWVRQDPHWQQREAEPRRRTRSCTAATDRRPNAITRALDYLAACDPAVSGQGGHPQTFAVARALVWGFDLGAEVGFDLLWEHYNPRCLPPWSEKELRHKCQDADTKPFGKPRGYLLHEGRRPMRASAGPPGAQPSANGEAGRPPPRLVTVPLDTVALQPVRWLVPDLVPQGKLTLLAGDGGLCKSTITLDVAARVTTGQPCCGLNYDPPPPGDVLLFSCEDDTADTVVPRLLSAGADLKRCHAVKGVQGEDGKCLAFSLADLDALRSELLARPEVRLVVVDLVSAFVGRAGVDDHRDSELRSLLSGLTDVAAEARVAIVLIAHLNKAQALKAVARILGSVGYVNAVRSALLAVPDPEDDSRRLLLPVKVNLTPERQGLAYRPVPLPPDEQQQVLSGRVDHLPEEDRQRLAAQLYRVVWCGKVDTRPDDALGAARKERDPNKVERCAGWLRELLAAYAFPSDEIVTLAKEESFTFDNVKEAKARLKAEGLHNTCKGFRGAWWTGFGDPGGWTPRPDSLAPHSPHSPHSGQNPGNSGGAAPGEVPQTGQSGESRGPQSGQSGESGAAAD
jgi:hypothetical protein